MKRTRPSRKKVSARFQLEKRYPGFKLWHWKNAPGVPSDYLLHLQDVPVEQPVILICRVSGRCQEWNRNLDHQQWDSCRKIADLGHRVLEILREVGSGWILTPEGRPVFQRAVELAKSYDAIIVFHDTDRVLRNIDYRHDNDVMPTILEFEKFIELAKGVRVATILHPDIPRKGNNGIRSQEIRRALEFRKSKPGRPKKKRRGQKKARREQLLTQALDLHNHWATYREIAQELGLPTMTVHGWIRRHWRDYVRRCTVPK